MEINNTSQVTTMLPFTKWLIGMCILARFCQIMLVTHAVDEYPEMEVIGSIVIEQGLQYDPQMVKR